MTTKPGFNFWHKSKGTVPAMRHFLIAQDTGHGQTKRYMACDTFAYMKERLSDVVNAHEVIDKMECPVWLFCDYDGDDNVIKFSDQQVRKVLSDLIRRVLKDEYNLKYVTEFCSTATTAVKTSLHMKMNVLFADMYGLKEFMLKVRDRGIAEGIPELQSVKPDKESLIDASVYRNFALYRCVGMTKYGKDNELVCMDGADQESHFVKFYQLTKVVPDTVIPALGPPNARRDGGAARLARLTMELESPDVYHTDVLRRYTDYINSYECITEKLGAKVVVSKITTHTDQITTCSIQKDHSHICPCAGRTHASNNLYAVVNMGRNTVSIRCHDEACKGKSGIVARAYDNTDAHDRRDVTTMHSQESNIRWCELYDEDSMRDYPLHPLVCVRAGMGTGKTQALKRLATTFETSTKALIVTHSRALAARMHAEFEAFGFVKYDEVEGDILDAKVVVCLDSISRVRTSSFSFVFLDEAVSLFLHLNSPLMGNKTSVNLSVLELSIIQAKHTYFLDACMDHTFGKSVVDYFADQKGCTPYWIRNTYVRPTNRKMFLDIVPMEGSNIVTKSSQLTRAIEKVLELVQANKNVVVCSSSKSFTVRLQNFIFKCRPKTRMIVYNSDSHEKLDNVEEYWKTCQLLVYSPTITAGVSFEESHFDCLVAFVSNSHFAPTVDITLQQLFRVRQLRDGDMHLFVHEFKADPESEDSMPYPETREQIVDFLQSDISFASKYFATHKINVQSTYRPSKERVLQYDVDKLSFLVIVGILMMRNRSTVYFSTLLADTLHEDYGMPCEVMSIAQNTLTRTQMDMLKASPSKLPPVSFAEVLAALDTDLDNSNGNKRVTQAARHLLQYKNDRWHVPTLEPEALQKFYEAVTMTNAQELHHQAKRFVALCDHTLEENKDEFAKCMIHTLDSGDPNITVFKRRMHAYHMKIILGRQYLEALIDGKSELYVAVTKHEKIEIHEDVCLDAYKKLIDGMSQEDADYFRNLFLIKAPTGLMVAKWILGAAFGMDVRRRDKKPGRTNFSEIIIQETYLRDMENKFGANLRSKNMFAFLNRPAAAVPNTA